MSSSIVSQTLVSTKIQYTHSTNQNPDRAAATEKFAKLISQLHDYGFDTSVRNGDKHSLLIFVKLGSHRHLYAEVYRSR